jgi:hypothetical protein
MLRLLRTFSTGERRAVSGPPSLLARGAELHLSCGDGGVLRVLNAELGGTPFDADALRAIFKADAVPLESAVAPT